MTETKSLQFSSIGVGKLGAFITGFGDGVEPTMLRAAQLDMIECRILRIEMALRQAGIEVEALELPK
ncbi:hypothetical protein OOT33_13840 [Sphingobium sp. DEHP117]|uniref:hypothetical protein n=1 Tax=Sphingobium sp. DEHP117 TaxID=2993436 RepID=UPI0027D5417D|nr:hypothetical protein [Sphingobium sp. DEHP117]MDQ4421505.1 hypothetical protein [Sphingobium sp. DEHP117]